MPVPQGKPKNTMEQKNVFRRTSLQKISWRYRKEQICSAIEIILLIIDSFFFLSMIEPSMSAVTGGKLAK